MTANMQHAFEHMVEVKVGPDGETFSVHTERLSTHLSYFNHLLSSGKTLQLWNLPNITPHSFHLLLDYVYGGTLRLSWVNEEQRVLLVDAWILGDMVGATGFTDLIMKNILTNAIRPGQGRIFPDSKCIARAYEPGVLEPNPKLRRLFVDLYVHFGTADELNILLMGEHRLRDFWFDYCNWTRCRDEYDAMARKQGEELYMFNPSAYYNRSRSLVMPEPLAVTRPGTKAYLCHYDGVNMIVIDDGEPPVFIHRELSELRHRILMKSKPRSFHFAAGWRKAVVIFLRWLYYGCVTHKCHDMKDFIRAYNVGLTFHNAQFVDDVLTGMISFYTRNQLLPSRSEIALAYTLTPTTSPLRAFMVYWTLTHPHPTPITPSSLPLPPALRAQFATDTATETAARTASTTADTTTHPPLSPSHPRPYADEMFASAPYYGDDPCRYHTAHGPAGSYPGYATPIANTDAAINGGATAVVDPRDPAVALFGYCTKLLAASAATASSSSAASGYTNPANDIQRAGAANPCHALLRKRNCYGAVVIGIMPANEPATSTANNVSVRDFGAADSPYTSPTSPRLVAAFPAQPVRGPKEVAAGEVRAFNALRLQGGWRQRRCVDGRAYFVGGGGEVGWVDPRGGVGWRRVDEEVVGEEADGEGVVEGH